MVSINSCFENTCSVCAAMGVNEPKYLYSYRLLEIIPSALILLMHMARLNSLNNYPLFYVEQYAKILVDMQEGGNKKSRHSFEFKHNSMK